MRVLWWVLKAGILLSLAAVALGIVAVAALLFTQGGQDFARSQTQDVIARVLGPNFSSSLGEQTVEMRRDGTLAIGWRDVAVARVDDPAAPTEIDHVAFALRLVPLLRGDLKVARLEIEGADVDLQAFLQGQAEGPRLSERSFSTMADGAVTALERQLATLNAIGFDSIAFRDITLQGVPGLAGDQRVEFAELSRRGSGALDLSTALNIGPLAMSFAGSAEFQPDGALHRLGLRSSPVALGDIIPVGPADDPDDERRFATNADLAATFEVARLPETDKLASNLTLTAGPGAIQVGRNRTRIDEARLRLRHEEGANRVEILPSPMRFTGVSFDLAGGIDLFLDDADGETIDFALRTDDLASTVGQNDPDAEPERADVRVAGRLQPARGRAELNEFVVDTGGGELSGTGVLDLSEPGARTTFSLVGGGVDAKAVKAFWPFNLAGRPREWVLDHVGDEALVDGFAVGIDVRRDRFAGAFGQNGHTEPDELAIDIGIENADLQTVGDLPRLYNADGTLKLRGTRTRIDLRDAMVEGFEAVALGGSSLQFSKPEGGNPRDVLLDLSVAAAGSVPQLLAIADRPPIRALRSLPITSEKTSGTANARATVALLLGPEVGPDDRLLNWGVEADLVAASLAEPLEGRMFTNLTGNIAVDPGKAVGSLDGFMDSIPAQIALAMPVGPQPTVERRVEIDLELTAEKALEIVPALTGALDGPIDAALLQTAEGLTIDLDLARASLQIPAVAWTKGRGVPATLSAGIRQADGEMRLENIRLQGSGFSAAGSALIDGRGLRSADLTQVTLNPGDEVALRMDRTPNGFSMTVNGRQFDARPILQQLRAEAGRFRPSNDSGLTFDIDASVERVRGFEETVMRDVSLNYASYNGRVAALSLIGRTGQGSTSADLSPREGMQSISIATDDLGAFVAFTGLYPNIEGGTARLQLTGTPDGRYGGRVDARGFTIVDDPRLERIVGSQPAGAQASLSDALGQDLRTSRAFFDQASAELGYADGRLAVSGGILRGPVFGSSFEGILYDSQGRIDISGSFMPAYTVNRIFGELPLVGRLLGNGNEGGLIGITYRLAGAFGSPSLTVNPISIIAPGVFRQIFEY